MGGWWSGTSCPACHQRQKKRVWSPLWCSSGVGRVSCPQPSHHPNSGPLDYLDSRKRLRSAGVHPIKLQLLQEGYFWTHLHDPPNWSFHFLKTQPMERLGILESDPGFCPWQALMPHYTGSLIGGTGFLVGLVA